MPRFGRRFPPLRRFPLGSVAQSLLPGSMAPGAAIQAGQVYTIVGSAIAYIAATSLLTNALTTQYTQVISVDTSEITGLFSIQVMVITPPGAGTVADLLNLADQQLGAVSGLQFGYLETSGLYAGAQDESTLAAGVGMATKAVASTAANVATQAATGITAGIGSGVASTISSGGGWVTIALIVAAAFVGYKLLD
jgi:hypothetical protein